MASAEKCHALSSDGAAFSVRVGACGVMAASLLTLLLLQLGSLSAHMAVHIVAMNAVAPFAAIALARRGRSRLVDIGGRVLWIATLMQIGLLWVAHSPPIFQAAHSSTMAFAALHLALFLSAVAFWTSVVASPSNWQAMLALLMTGKLACLLAALLIFAPRVLLDAHAAHGNTGMPDSTSALADQHLAGLMMIAACPLSYVLTAIVLAAQTVTGLSRVRVPDFRASVSAER